MLETRTTIRQALGDITNNSDLQPTLADDLNALDIATGGEPLDQIRTVLFDQTSNFNDTPSARAAAASTTSPS